jgi:hypothetical protein
MEVQDAGSLLSHQFCIAILVYSDDIFEGPPQMTFLWLFT